MSDTEEKEEDEYFPIEFMLGHIEQLLPNRAYGIDSLTGLEKKKLYTKSHGIGVAKYTHHDACILLSSGKLSIHDPIDPILLSVDS